MYIAIVSTFQSLATIYLSTLLVLLVGYFAFDKILGVIDRRKAPSGSNLDRFAGNVLRLWLLSMLFSFVGGLALMCYNYIWFHLHPPPPPHHRAAQVSR